MLFVHCEAPHADLNVVFVRPYQGTSTVFVFLPCPWGLALGVIILGHGIKRKIQYLVIPGPGSLPGEYNILWFPGIPAGRKTTRSCK